MLHRVVGSETTVTIPEKMLDDIHIETVTDDPDLRHELAENRLLHVKRNDRSAFSTEPIHVCHYSLASWQPSLLQDRRCLPTKH